MGHRNRVEGDGAAVAAAAELKWSGVLLSVVLSVVHSSLVVVTRAAAAVERAEVVAVLIALSDHPGQLSHVLDKTKPFVGNSKLVGMIGCNARQSNEIDAEVQEVLRVEADLIQDVLRGRVVMCRAGELEWPSLACRAICPDSPRQLSLSDPRAGRRGVDAILFWKRCAGQGVGRE